jgi:demethylmenaquinone methyltransferase/2-methoxy-6-polyprenyl-1,4-benzoquinol methylase
MAGAPDKAAAVRGMFGAIAPRYDLLNHLLSLNLDRVWRRRAVDRLLQDGPTSGLYLDSCAGTLDLTREIAARRSFAGNVVAMDFSLPMLLRGGAKAHKRRGAEPQSLAVAGVCADALRMPVRDGTFDGAIVGFGIRNLASLEEGLRELARVLRPGAKLVILEFTTPSRWPIRPLYLFYFRRLLPLIGRTISKHKSAYDYLPASVLEFPAPAVLASRLREAGFDGVDWKVYSGGVVAVHVARRAQAAG